MCSNLFICISVFPYIDTSFYVEILCSIVYVWLKNAIHDTSNSRGALSSRAKESLALSHAGSQPNALGGTGQALVEGGNLVEGESHPMKMSGVWYLYVYIYIHFTVGSYEFIHIDR